MPSVANRVRRFIVDDLGWEGTADELPDDLPLIKAGVFDSLGILMLVQFLESTYDIAIDDGDVIPAHLGTLASIEQYVESKSTAAGPVPHGIQPSVTPNVSKLSRATGRAGFPR